MNMVRKKSQNFRMTTLLRLNFKSCLFGLIRGPKKAAPAASKKGKGKSNAAESVSTSDSESGHIFNIFSGVSDLKDEPDDTYPKWLWSLAEPAKSYATLSSTFIYGKDIENATAYDYRRFLRQHRKLVIKVNNARLKKSKNPVEGKIRIP